MDRVLHRVGPSDSGTHHSDLMATFTFKFRIDWRRGPRELRAALREVRIKLLEEIAKQIVSNAPHPSIARSVKQTPAQVAITHPAAMIFEFGVAPGLGFPPIDKIRAWAISVGKDPDSAFPVARSIQKEGLEAQPYILPAIEASVKMVPGWMRDIWEGRR